jgi:hypothetical protein
MPGPTAKPTVGLGATPVPGTARGPARTRPVRFYRSHAAARPLPWRYDVPLPPVPERVGRNLFVVPTIMSMVPLPLAFAYAAEVSPLGLPRTDILVAGVVCVPLLFGAVLWLVNVRMNAMRKRELDRRLRAEGIDPTEMSGVQVAFAPDRERCPARA